MSNKDTVFLIFEDEDISHIFADLLRAHGQPASFSSNPDSLPEECTIMTEPKFYSNLSPQQRARSLVIGNKTALEKIETATLSRPLTEEKIEQALNFVLNYRSTGN